MPLCAECVTHRALFESQVSCLLGVSLHMLLLLLQAAWSSNDTQLVSAMRRLDADIGDTLELFDYAAAATPGGQECAVQRCTVSGLSCAWQTDGQAVSTEGLWGGLTTGPRCCAVLQVGWMTRF